MFFKVFENAACLLFEALHGALGLVLPAFYADLDPKWAPKWSQKWSQNGSKKESKKDPKNITLRVSDIRDSNLGLSFIRLAGFIFHDALSSIVDPVAEKLKERFKSTKSLHLSIYSIVSIEEVGVNHTGLTFEKDKSNILVLSDRQ